MAFDPRITCSYLYLITRYGYPPPAEDTVAHLREIHALGFRSVELEGIRRDHLLAMEKQSGAIRDVILELGLSVPVFCVVLPGLSSPDARERAANLDVFRVGCTVAAAFGARSVLDNAPLPPYRFPGDIPVVRHFDEEVLRSAALPPDLDWKRYWWEMVGTYRDACDIAAAAGLSYLLHPCLGVLAATTDGFLYLRDAVARENLRFTLDTANQFFLKDNLMLSLRRLGPLVEYVHLSDNRGDRVEHLVPGDGRIDWETFFAALAAAGFRGSIGIDVGGAESGVQDIAEAYRRTAAWLASRWTSHPS